MRWQVVQVTRCESHLEITKNPLQRVFTPNLPITLTRSAILKRFPKGLQRNITYFLKASVTTDRIKIFSITFCILVTVY